MKTHVFEMAAVGYAFVGSLPGVSCHAEKITEAATNDTNKNNKHNTMICIRKARAKRNFETVLTEGAVRITPLKCHCQGGLKNGLLANRKEE